MKYIEHSLFPKPVITMEYEEEFKQELEYIKNIPHNRNGGSDTGQISINKYLLYEPEMKKLKEFFQEALNLLMSKIYNSPQKVVISQSWATLINKGEGFRLHDHPNSLINGVFYFDRDRASSPLGLANGRKSSLYPDIISQNKYNSDTYYITPKEGELILFPNNLNHHVPLSGSELERRSIAFNTFIIDKLGSEVYMTEIDLEKIIANNK